MKRSALVALGVALMFLPSYGLAGETDSEKKPHDRVLETVARCRLGKPTGKSTLTDVRWWGKKRFLVQRASDGVNEYEANSAGTCRAVAMVLPSFAQEQRLGRANMLAVSSGLVMAAGKPGNVVWRRRESRPVGGGLDAESRRFYGGGIGDIDVRGETMAVLGVPSAEVGDKDPRATLWTSSLASTFGEFEPLHQFKELASDADVNKQLVALYAGGGSLRYLPDGDLLVYPGYPAAAYRITPAGSIKKRWELPELSTSADAFARLVQDYSADKQTVAFRQFSNTNPMVEDVFVVGKTPALVVRTAGEKPRWYVVLLGGEPEWFRVPVESPDTSLRARADGNAEGE